MAQAIAKNQKVVEYGPYGSQLPVNYHLQIAEGEHVKEIIVRHGFIVDAVGLLVEKPDGTTYTMMTSGTNGNSKVALRAGEYVTRISGTSGNYKYQQNNGVVIGTLKIHTNLNPNGYGPFGKGQEVANVQNFASPQLTDGPVIGFFGRNGGYIESIGILTKAIEEYGPYGSKLPETYRMQIANDEHVKEVIVKHGFIVDAVGLVVEKPNGTTYTMMTNGNTGNSKVVLKAGEYVTKISGTSGNYKYQQNNGVVIGTLKIHTNLNPNGYGPFGKGQEVVNVQNFASPLQTSGHAVGFFGRSGGYVESIGILIKTEVSN